MTSTIREIPQEEVPLGRREGRGPSLVNLDNLHVVPTACLGRRIGIVAPHGSACPGQTDGIIIWSWYQCRSEPQMPQLRTRTRTPPGPGVGRGTSWTTSRPTPRQKAARMAGTRASYSGDATRATTGHRLSRREIDEMTMQAREEPDS